jgi:hypothetical protein
VADDAHRVIERLSEKDALELSAAVSTTANASIA